MSGQQDEGRQDRPARVPDPDTLRRMAARAAAARVIRDINQGRTDADRQERDSR